MATPTLTRDERETLKKELISRLSKEMSEAVEKEVRRQMGSHERENDVRAIVASSLVRLFKALYNRQSFWSKDV